MDRIARIIELEGQAAKPEKIASATRWETARLYWQEARSGTSQAEIAAGVGKSRPHVTYMVKCWEVCGRLLKGKLASFPDFQSVYRSAEVRGQSAEPASGGERGGDGRRRERRPEDIHTQAARLAILAEPVAAGLAALSAAERREIRHAVRTLERALAAGRPGRAA